MAEDYGAFVDSPVASDTGYARLTRRGTVDGVVLDGPDAGDQLTVTANNTSQITISAGYAMVGGWFYRTDTSVSLNVPPNSDSAERRDLVVIRADTTEAACYPHIIEGTPGATTWPTPTRDPGGQWDTVLARYTIAGGTAVVSPGDVNTSVRQGTVPAGAIPCTSGSRPADPFDGMTILETDTGRVAIYLGGWRTLSDTTYPTAWQPISIRSGYTSPSHGPSPSWRLLLPGRVELRGTIQRNSGALPSGAYIATVPSAAVPPQLRRYVGAAHLVSGGHSVRLEVTSPHSSTWAAGRIVPYRVSSYQPTWVALDGWTYDV